MGLRPAAAALAGAREISFTVLSMSASLIAVFIPILLMGGILGRLFREFSVTLAIAIAISLVVSVTTTPSMCAKFLRPDKERRHGMLYRTFEAGFNGLLGGYRRSLRWVLHHPALTLSVTIGTACFSIYLYIIIPKGFFPQQDTGLLQGNIQSAPNQAFAITSERLGQFMKILMSDPAIATAAGSVNGTRGFGQINIQLKPLGERNASADQVIARLRPKLQLPGSTLFLQSPQELRIGGRGGNAQFQYTVQADTIEDLQKWAGIMLDGIKALPQIRDSNTDLANRGLETRLVIDRDTASRVGVTPQIVDNALYSAFGQRQVSTMYKPLNQYHVVMEAELAYQQNPDALENIYVRSMNGVEVPLSSSIHYESGLTAQSINHQGQFPSVTLSFNLAEGVSLGEAVDAVKELERQVRMPANVHGNFQGTAQAFQASLANQPWLILAALLTVYIVLGVLYESYIHPITILYSLDRNREEKRDHDDRLCIGSRTQGGQGTVGRNLSSMLAPIPSDYDDDNSRAPGRIAASARQRNRSGNTPATGYHDCRRPGGESDTHVIYDTRCVFISRSRSAMAWKPHEITAALVALDQSLERTQTSQKCLRFLCRFVANLVFQGGPVPCISHSQPDSRNKA